MQTVSLPTKIKRRRKEIGKKLKEEAADFLNAEKSDLKHEKKKK